MISVWLVLVVHGLLHLRLSRRLQRPVHRPRGRPGHPDPGDHEQGHRVRHPPHFHQRDHHLGPRNT